MASAEPVAMRALVLAALLVVPVAAEAGPDIGPQISYSIALGQANDNYFGHMWLGAGINSRATGGLFALVGIEGEVRDDYDIELGEDRHVRLEGGAEAWAMVRIGLGVFLQKRWRLAPMASIYGFTGQRIAGPTHRPTMRTGLGVSLPALIIPLAEIGIPTMVEGGIDYGGRGSEPAGFIRAGWNF